VVLLVVIDEDDIRFVVLLAKLDILLVCIYADQNSIIRYSLIMIIILVRRKVYEWLKYDLLAFFFPSLSLSSLSYYIILIMKVLIYKTLNLR
jgi:hypothetical protein